MVRFSAGSGFHDRGLDPKEPVVSSTPTHPTVFAQAATDPQESRRVFDVRPWGSWLVLDVGEGYKVKRISVSPHARLSLQTHMHRSEHWVVVTGVATCTVGDRTVMLGPGGRLDVPKGAAHRIANEADDIVILVELQLGDYTGEDDIVRLADDYGR
jgi:mannose-6-phosphate isomerase-like protein (cupin superfamily)